MAKQSQQHAFNPWIGASIITLLIVIILLFGFMVLAKQMKGMYKQIQTMETAQLESANIAAKAEAENADEALDPSDADSAPVEETPEADTDLVLRYESTKYGFALTFPESWAGWTETVEAGPTNAYRALVTLTHPTDSRRFVGVYIVKAGSELDPSVRDLPAVPVGTVQGRYLISGGGDFYGYPGMEDAVYGVIADEVELIRASFERI